MSSNASFLSSILGWLKGLLTGDLGDGGTRAGRRIDSGAVAIDEIEPGDGPEWGTLSGLAAHPTDASIVYACADQDSPPARIVAIDVSRNPPRVVRQIVVDAPGIDHLDIEAVTAKRDGGFWLASEGGDFDEPPNLVLEIDASGKLLRRFALPESISVRVQRKGFEGIALVEHGGATLVFVAFQGGLAEDPHDTTRICALDPATGTWRFWTYPLSPGRDGDPTGISELLHLGGARFAAIERDGKGGRKSVKWLTTFTLDIAAGAPPEATPPRVAKRVALDLVPLFLDRDMKVEKEIEGLAVSADGQLYAINDNDNERATLLLRLGRARDVLG